MSYTGSVPDTVARPRDWMGQAACRDDVDLFFDLQRVHEARAVCVVRCPVRAQCLASVMAREEGTSEHSRDEGVFAGLDRRQRWRLDPKAPGKGDDGPATAAVELPQCGTAAALEHHLARGEAVDGTCWSGELRRHHVSHRVRRTDGEPEALPEAP
ncbi:WhiB family transcriptional regulator [Streptomyces cinnabarinus]|uniref:WhiB family transcriptional regulator n=1 Tax=Streptomyces cinnabarinus TaxID=67287 RepID=A0ABY7K9A9_9ACTN|nr:WhiB family transcriptional regulator [Streptomyces cinnabarinus]WAZ20225.1 WhiB family transcriptional regulator [Streptomyces cinnabarinus]